MLPWRIKTTQAVKKVRKNTTFENNNMRNTLYEHQMAKLNVFAPTLHCKLVFVIILFFFYLTIPCLYHAIPRGEKKKCEKIKKKSQLPLFIYFIQWWKQVSIENSFLPRCKISYKKKVQYAVCNIKYFTHYVASCLIKSPMSS